MDDPRMVQARSVESWAVRPSDALWEQDDHVLSGVEESRGGLRCNPTHRLHDLAPLATIASMVAPRCQPWRKTEDRAPRRVSLGTQVPLTSPTVSSKAMLPSPRFHRFQLKTRC
jgi:hypothetical protein